MVRSVSFGITDYGGAQVRKRLCLVMTRKNVMTTSIENTNGSEMIGNTGWSWQDAASEAKDAARMHRLFPRNGRGNRRNRSRNRRNDVGLMVTNPARFERETGWTPEAALQMAFDERKEDRIFGRRQGL